MKTFQDLINDCAKLVKEIFPWDLVEELEQDPRPLLLDIREPEEFEAMHIANSIHVPRGILEAACDYGYTETIPEMVNARDQRIVLICRSGNRSVLAAHTMQLMGYSNVVSLKTGIKGWNDDENPLVDHYGKPVDGDFADMFLNPPVQKEQLKPK